MSHQVTRKCPFCGQDNQTSLDMDLITDSGGSDTDSPLNLNDYESLLKPFSFEGLQTLLKASRTLSWTCTNKSCRSHYVIEPPQAIPADPKVRVARDICGVL